LEIEEVFGKETFDKEALNEAVRWGEAIYSAIVIPLTLVYLGCYR
jgi:hypothetical protein